MVLTHPLWRPFNTAAASGRRQRRIDQRQVSVSSVVAHEAGWAQQFQLVRGLIERSLGEDALSISHVGSTAVPGLCAKPIIDVDLLVVDPTAEDAYLPSLSGQGFRLIAREPEWEEHRCLTYAIPNCNVHVFSVGALEPQRHNLFRRWLMENDADRKAYGALKVLLAGENLQAAGDYNGQKAGFIYDLYEKAFVADPVYQHDPHPRE